MVSDWLHQFLIVGVACPRDSNSAQLCNKREML